MAGTDAATYTRERPGMSAFVLEDGVVYHTYSAYARGLDGLWGMYQWLDRAPQGPQRDGAWWRRHDEYSRARRDMSLHAGSRHSLFGVSALVFAASAVADDRLVRVHVGDVRHADARRLDDVDGVDADAGPDVARRRGVVPRHVDGDDGRDDAAVAGADAVALPRGRRRDQARPASVG